MDVVIVVTILVASVILHEVAHGVVALRLGDDTAKRRGRLTLNPIPHIDPVGSLLLPAVLATLGFGAIGYAKPVPVDLRRLRDPRNHAVLVALAGPATNLLIVAACAVVLRATGDLEVPDVGDVSWTPSMVVFAAGFTNLLLAVFNLLPIPPLDGSAVVERALPRRWLRRWHRLRPYSIVLVLGLVLALQLVSGADDALIGPVFDWWESIAG